MSPLTFRERPAAGEPAGLLVLHHGRGADENDLLALGDALDPERRPRIATPRALLTPPGLARLPLLCGPARRVPGPGGVSVPRAPGWPRFTTSSGREPDRVQARRARRIPRWDR